MRTFLELMGRGVKRISKTCTMLMSCCLLTSAALAASLESIRYSSSEQIPCPNICLGVDDFAGIVFGLDHGTRSSNIDTFEGKFKKLGGSVNIKIYPDAGHAFESGNIKTAYRGHYSADAQQRNLKRFAEKLGGSIVAPYFV